MSLMLSKMAEHRAEQGLYRRWRCSLLTSATARAHSAGVYGRSGSAPGACEKRRESRWRAAGAHCGPAVGGGEGACGEAPSGGRTLVRVPAVAVLSTRGMRPGMV